MSGPGQRQLKQQLDALGVDFTQWMDTVYPKHYTKGVSTDRVISNADVAAVVAELKLNMEKEAPQEPDNNLDIGGFHI